MSQFAPALSLALERVFGYPQGLQRVINHPVQWIGFCIAKLEAGLYGSGFAPHKMKERGIILVVLLLLICTVPAIALSLALSQFSYGWVFNAMLATPFLAQKSLRQHVQAVADALKLGLPQARAKVAMIVGRNPNDLDEDGIARAALESLAENCSDGVVAPLLWYVVAGLPGIIAYKAINTADSMIGHKSERYLHFGWAAARLDDLVNLPASRLTGLLFAAAAMLNHRVDGLRSLEVMKRDASNHRSPNAGWPEAAMAGALDITLGGARAYGDEKVDLPVMGDGRRVLHRDDIARGLIIYSRALTLLFCLTLLWGALI